MRSTIPKSAVGNRKPRGLSLVELMISLAIATMLLTAVAAAFSASAAAIETNDRFFRATQAARVSMNQILTEIRRSDAVEVSSGKVSLIRPAEIIGPNEKFRTFRHLPDERKLVLTITDMDDDISPDYTLASNVVTAEFVADSRLDEIQPGVYVNVIVRVSITLVVEVGNDRIRLSGSAVPRRSMLY